MLIDTHAHLDFPDFAQDLDAILDRAAAAGVTRVITIGTSITGSRRAVALAEKYPQVFAVVGVHPNSADEADDNFIDELRAIARSPRVVAIGETGLDYHYLPSSRRPADTAPVLGNETPGDIDAALADGANKSRQAAVFEQQLDLAVELGLNVVVHERDAWDDTLAILRPYAGKLRAVFHCFGKSPAHAAELRALGFLISFTGIVTFKNAADAQAAARQADAGHFMIETDCPFLAPIPHRGKRCEPAYTRLVAEHLARLRGTSLETIATETTATAEGFFRFPHQG